MIRRSTWIVFAIFLILALAAIFLFKSPSSPISASAGLTPSATTAPRAIDGWDTTQVTGIEYLQANGTSQKLVRNPDGSWTDAQKQSPVETGLVEQLLSELLTIRVLTTMPSDFSLDVLQLASPNQEIIITRQDGVSLSFKIGSMTPTGNGYYVRIDSNPPVVVSNYALDAVTQLFADIQATATPAATITLEATSQP